MDFQLSCECGNSVTMTEAAAGREIDCPCGRTIKVPSFRELRQRAGMPADNVSPALMIQHLLERGELYPPADCVWCGAESDDVLHINVECEREWREDSRTLSDVTAFILLGWIGYILVQSKKSNLTLGKDVIFQLPVTVCPKCRDRFVPEERLRICRAVRWMLLGMALATVFFVPLLGAWFMNGYFAAWILEATWKHNYRCAMKDTLCQVPLYAQLLERYPDAELKWFSQ